MAVGRVKRNLWRESWVGSDRHSRRSTGPPRKLARRRGFHLRHVTISRRQELPRRRLGPGDRTRGSRVRIRPRRLQGRLSQRPVGHGADLQANRPRLRSVHRVRAASGRAIWNRRRGLSPRVGRAGRSSRCSSNSSRRGDRSVGTVGELSRVLGADQLAVPQRRSRRVQRVPTGERLHEPFEVATASSIPPGSYHWLRYRLEAGTAQKRRLLHAADLVVRRLLQRDAGSVSVDRRVESEAARHGRILRRAERRDAADRATSRRRWSVTGCA